MRRWDGVLVPVRPSGPDANGMVRTRDPVPRMVARGVASGLRGDSVGPGSACPRRSDCTDPDRDVPKRPDASCNANDRPDDGFRDRTDEPATDRGACHDRRACQHAAIRCHRKPVIAPLRIRHE